MHVHRNGELREQALHAPHMVEVPVREEDGVGGEVLPAQEFHKLGDSLVGAHAGVYERAGRVSIGPDYDAIGTQRVELKYAGMEHNG